MERELGLCLCPTFPRFAAFARGNEQQIMKEELGPLPSDCQYHFYIFTEARYIPRYIKNSKPEVTVLDCAK
jgi:hypothetical protein